jgi:ElaB/YqjD/DUF883 family membrane-anchored ribosome-binding protein
MMNQKNDQTVAHQAADVVDNVADGVRSAAQSVGDSVRSAAQTARDAAGRAVDAVEETYQDVSQYARKSLKRTGARARSWEKSFESSVRHNPKTSLLIAAAIGAVIGVWCKRK